MWMQSKTSAVLAMCCLALGACYSGEEDDAAFAEGEGSSGQGTSADVTGSTSGPSGGSDAATQGETGSSATGESTTTGEEDVPPEHEVADDLECDAQMAPMPWLKLSTEQYRNTVADLLVAVGAPEVVEVVEPAMASIPDDSLGEGFRGLDDRISQEHIQGYFNVAKGVADAITEDPEILEAVVGSCGTEATLSESCIGDFAEAFVTRAYRRPVTEEELASLQSLNDGARTPAQALRAIILVVLSSPHFVSHAEVHGTSAGGNSVLFDLTPHELASRLSYTFWQTMPDDALLQAAADGSLATEAGFLTQLDRVFADPRTRETLWQFWREWLLLEKFTGFETSRPGFQALLGDEEIDPAALYAEMVEEVHSLTDLFTFDQSGTLLDLMSTPVSVTESQELAGLYGVEAWDGSSEYPTLAAAERTGLFQRAALLVNSLEQTNPFHRGSFVRRNLLCDPLPQPDPNTLPPGSLDPPVFDEAQTTRARYEAKVADNPLCVSCHAQFSDLGYALEAYDALGRYRTIETVYDEQTGEELASLPLNLETVPRIDFADQDPVSSVEQLNQKMIESGKVEACLAQNFYRYVVRRALASDSYDDCVSEDIASKVNDEDLGLAAAFKEIARYPTFLQRKVAP